MRKVFSVFFATFALATPLNAVELKVVGVVGNSGVAGATLLKTRPGGYAGGVALDADYTLWHASSFDRLERISLDGRLLSAFRIENKLYNPGHNARIAIIGPHVLLMHDHGNKFFAMRRDADPAVDTVKPITLSMPSQLPSGAGSRVGHWTDAPSSVLTPQCMRSMWRPAKSTFFSTPPSRLIARIWTCCPMARYCSVSPRNQS